MLWPRPPAKGRSVVVRASPRPDRRGSRSRVADCSSAPIGRQPTGRGTAHKGSRLQGRLLAGATASKGDTRGGAVDGSSTGRKGNRRLRRGGVDDEVRVREEG
ncbi:hypothetical protein BHE74_00023751 [Ensete ventricosum]|nr:hypothetical protein BHE74_00023751 [Ensete ventricosum]